MWRFDYPFVDKPTFPLARGNHLLYLFPCSPLSVKPHPCQDSLFSSGCNSNRSTYEWSFLIPKVSHSLLLLGALKMNCSRNRSTNGLAFLFPKNLVTLLLYCYFRGPRLPPRCLWHHSPLS